MKSILIMFVVVLGLVVCVQQTTIFQLKSACANYSEAICTYETDVVPVLTRTINILKDKKSR